MSVAAAEMDSRPVGWEFLAGASNRVFDVFEIFQQRLYDPGSSSHGHTRWVVVDEEMEVLAVIPSPSIAALLSDAHTKDALVRMFAIGHGLGMDTGRKLGRQAAEGEIKRTAGLLLAPLVEAVTRDR